MQKRKLGDTGFKVAPLAFGGNVFGWTADEPTSTTAAPTTTAAPAPAVAATAAFTG